MRALRLFPLTAYLLPLTACAVTPLSNRIAVGEDAFVIGVGEGPDSMTDLYAAPAGGGAFVRLTFSRPDEDLPRLSPSGDQVAFVRGDGQPGRWSLVILDLRTSLEQSAPLPEGTAAPRRVGWTPNGDTVLVDAGGYFILPTRSGARSLVPAPPGLAASADSATSELLGEPGSAVLRECPGGGVCTVSANGAVSRLEAAVAGAIRWGADSVGYFTARGFEVRPLAGGRVRHPDWSGAPSGLRHLTHHPGRS